MTTAEQLDRLLKTLPEAQLTEVLHFAQFLQHKHPNPQPTPPSIPPGTLTSPHSTTQRATAIQRMQGLLKTDQPAPTDEEVEAMLEEWRKEKYL